VIDVHPEVRAALDRGTPVVALESTISAHGMPHPHNIAVARSLESIVRSGGATPATIAVIGGRIKIGLDDDALAWLGTAPDVRKLSRGDLGHAIVTGTHGATTVAATMRCAHLAGIGVFATGGIGGVHRGAETTMDVSADLDELARTPVAVVCAGAKALLDLPKTLEALETRGVPVVGYRSGDFPAFWSRSSGLKLGLRLDSAAELAALIGTERALGGQTGILIANPIPAAAEIPAAEIDAHIERALADAHEAHITGAAVTPFLLDRIYASTAGRSLTANIALVENNVRLAVDVAVALAEIAPTAQKASGS
jgi:pseudouridylate synthase